MASFVGDIVQIVRTNIPDAQPEALFRIAQSICHGYGGAEPYVGKLLPRELHKEMIGHGLRQQKSLKECFAQAGVGRTLGYQLLKRR